MKGFHKHLSTSASSVTIDLPNNGEYQFTVRVKTRCGLSPPSAILRIHTKTEKKQRQPSQIVTLEVKQLHFKCGLKLQWNPPESYGSSEILGYRVQLKVKGDFVGAPLNCGLNGKTACVIPMRLLAREPYNYRTSDKIQGRVAAVN